MADGTTMPMTVDTLTRRVEHLSDRFLRLVEEDPRSSVRVAGTPDWSVRDVLAHMVTVVTRYADGPEGGGDWVDDPKDLPALNERLLRDLGDADVDELVRRIRTDVQALGEQVRGYGTQVPSFAFNGGRPVRADDALGILAGEFLVHGWDVANAVGAPWRLTRPDVELVLHGIEPVLPGFVDPAGAGGHTATYEIRLRGGRTYRWRFEDGVLDCRPDTDGAVHCYLSADAATLMLVMYGRLSPLRAALTGKVFAWGRRFWLGLSLSGRFHNP